MSSVSWHTSTGGLLACFGVHRMAFLLSHRHAQKMVSVDEGCTLPRVASTSCRRERSMMFGILPVTFVLET